MGLKKRVSALLLAVSLSFGVCATDYLEVQALEWAGVTIGLDTALKFLLGLVGVSVGVGVADSIDWTETREQCITFQQNQGNSAVAVSNWWADVIRGKLDTASECWTSFKVWVKNDLLSGSSSGGGSSVFSFSQFMQDGIVSYENGFTYTYTTAKLDKITSDLSGLSLPSWFSYNVPIFYGTNDDNSRYETVFYFLNPSFNYTFNSQNNSIICDEHNFDYVRVFCISGNSSRPASVLTSYPYTLSMYHTGSFYGVGFVEGISDVFPSDFEGAYENVTDIGLGSSIATDLPQEGILDIPWENVGDTAESVDGAIDNALENVNSGTWTLDQYWEYVQNITNVYSYDITNNYLLPNDGNNETTEDKVQENVDRSAFVLAGLEKVFPFCIPWDIKDFVMLLVADPVAPVIEYPIYNPVTDSEEVITIDFSVWEDQVVVLRYIFDFLLIIGLLLLARSLIGAGGSD